MDKYNFLKQDALRLTEEQLLHTKVFYQNAGELYARYDDWKDSDNFYFIPPLHGDDLQLLWLGCRDCSRSCLAGLLYPLHFGASGTIPVQVPEVWKDGTPIPLRWLTPQRPCGSGRPL